MAGAFLAGGSAAPIAAFTAIARRGRRRFAPAVGAPTRLVAWGARAGASRRMARGTILLRDAKPPFCNVPSRLARWAKNSGRRRKIVVPAPLQTGSGRRLLASIEKDQPLPGAAGRSPLVKAAARLFPAGYSALQRKPLSLPARHRANDRDQCSASRRAIGSGSVC